MAEQLARLNKDFDKLVDVPLTDIFVSTSNINTASGATWAKRCGKVLYLSIETPVKTAAAWTRPAGVFKAPYDKVKVVNVPAIGWTGSVDGMYVVETNNGQRVFSYFVKQLSGNQNALSALMILIID